MERIYYHLYSKDAKFLQFDYSMSNYAEDMYYAVLSGEKRMVKQVAKELRQSMEYFNRRLED